MPADKRSIKMQHITLIKPDDFHLHLRDGAEMASVVRHSASVFARALIMPNLLPPVTSCAHALDYRQRILAALDHDDRFNPLMSLYLTDHTSVKEIEKIADSEHIKAIKYYPVGATTNADQAVRNIKNVYPVIESMQLHKIPLLMHGEVVDPSVDIFDRERIFIETVLAPLIQHFPAAKLVLEHITTKDAVQFIEESTANIAATITPQHLLLNRNDLFDQGLRPHHYCAPILKSELDRKAIVAAAVSGNKKFFLGTDSAPHTLQKKQAYCGCAGIYSAHAAIPLYAEVFDKEHKLANLEAFASKNGADFYALPYNKDTITLTKKEWAVPQQYPFGDGVLIPLRAKEKCLWTITT